uniref:Pepsin-I3 domain-containing protein n=1 Tax=Strongyloides papillosus TaxID=174720 RepID=A0A0N5B5D9_STREA
MSSREKITMNCTARPGLLDPTNICADCISIAIPLSNPVTSPVSVPGGALPNGLSECLSFLGGILVPPLYQWAMKTKKGKNLLDFAERTFPQVSAFLQKYAKKNQQPTDPPIETV